MTSPKISHMKFHMEVPLPKISQIKLFQEVPSPINDSLN